MIAFPSLDLLYQGDCVLRLVDPVHAVLHPVPHGANVGQTSPAVVAEVVRPRAVAHVRPAQAGGAGGEAEEAGGG